MKIRYFTKIFTGTLILLATSCQKDFLDINTDPNLPTTAELPKLLTNVEYNAGMTFAPGYYMGSILPSYVHHLTSREVDNYGISATAANLGNTWLQAYVSTLKNADAVIMSAEAEENMIYAGIGKLIKAYVFTGLVDLWGDIPYSEFNVEAITAPKADASQDIYNNLISLIEEAKANLNDTEAANLLKPKDADIIYKGDVEKWIRMANTLELRLLVQSRKAKGEITDWSAKLTALLNENNFLQNGEDFELKHSAQDNPDERNQAYVDEYLGGQSTYYINPWFYEIMSGKTYNAKENPFAGITDPRIPYYWVNQKRATDEAQNETDYRDGAFISILMASNSSAAGNDQRATSTFIGIYPCGGKYDDGQGGKCDQSVGNGIAPEKMIQAYSVPFMLAELVLAGEIAGDAKAYLQEGIEKSVYHVNSVSVASNATVPTIGGETLTTFLENIMKKYDAASAEGKMEIVMTQKWIANFFNSVEAYNDIRRTGYPKLFAPENGEAISPYLKDKTPTVGPQIVPLKGLNAFQRIMWYPNSEISRNTNIKNTGRNVSSSNVFWDK
ncbi:MAG: SusD/RagB family nutrient-binding outer membrane lipoprotein [Odoribacter sp.]|nr:SusD/RagB family nutrient-binding outer membrane lipoprotein [Odoribacter sp.]